MSRVVLSLDLIHLVTSTLIMEHSYTVLSLVDFMIS